MVVLTDALASLFKCEVNALQEHLNHPLAVNKVDAFMKDKRLRTTYLNRYGTKKEVKYTKLSLKSATQQEAYEGYLGISVRVHFYCRHRIRLLFPSLKCVSELNKKETQSIILSNYLKFLPMRRIIKKRPNYHGALDST